MLFLTGYDTTFGKSLTMTKTEAAIRESFVRDLTFLNHLDVIEDVPGDYSPVYIMNRYASESNIPLFKHPLLTHYKDRQYLVTDIRQYIRTTGDRGLSDDFSLLASNRTEFDFEKNRSLINLLWLSDDRKALRVKLGFAGMVYAQWLSETIARRYTLDPKDQMTLAVISHVYYQTLFFNMPILDEPHRELVTVQAKKDLNIPADFIFKIVDQLSSLSDIESYCQNVKSILENIRLETFSPAMLYNIIVNTWYGINSKELVAVAIEHPPTWMSIVYGSLVEKNYKNSIISKLSDRYGRNGKSEAYVRAYKEFIDALIRVG